MAVTAKSQRKAVVIGWEPLGGETTPDPPEGFPEHPIAPGGETPTHPIAPGGEAPDQGLPGDQPKPDQGLPGDQPKPDQGLPGDQPRPDQGLPPSGVGPEQPIFLPPFINNSLPGAVREALKGFLVGNLPPVAQPTGGKQIAVQIFAEGQKGDWSNTAVMPNDGEAALHYPDGFKGESYVEVRSLDGAVIDSGTIQVK